MTTHILLTGSSRGIGAATATAFVDDDVRLVGHGTSSGIPANFAEAGAAAELWRKALDALDGRVDVLINNAGVFEATPLDLSDDEWLAGWERTMRMTSGWRCSTSSRAAA